MADLSAVLRKTIDGLPSATPQLRAKVYEKARAAVQRQITNADPPFAEDVIEARHRALEDAIAQTEAHYTGGSAPAQSPAPPPPPVQAAAPAPVVPERPAFVPPPPPRAAPVEDEPRVHPEPMPPVAPAIMPPAPPSFAPPSYVPRTATVDAPAPATTPILPDAPAPSVSADGARAAFERQAQRAEPLGRSEPRAVPAFASTSQPLPGGEGGRAPVAPPPYGAGRVASSSGFGDARVGEIGPVPEEGLHPTAVDEDHHDDGDELSAPISYRQTPTRSRRSLYVGVASLAFLGLVGGLAYVYSDELRGALTGTEVAAVDPAPATATAPAATTETPAGEAAPAAATGSARAFTQRLQADGTEIDPGPAQEATNTLDEGTDVATATLIEPSQTPAIQPTAPEAPTETAAVAAPAEAPVAPAAGESAVPVGQRAVFYEERSPTSPGSQHGGNVVWSVVNEAPATGQPPEPAIRAVADVPDQSLRLTMTIRRNADETLPASHVIELMFDVPSEFAGGEIANVQRLALKPTEQARGEPLIGVAGRISDGFFIIALNDLDQAVTSNLALLRAQEWIDIPLAYSSGQRALFSLEKGLPGERVFREALDAWAARATSSAG